MTTCYSFFVKPGQFQRQHRDTGKINDITNHKYMVSIKSFLDYKQSLQENYSTWNTNIFFSGKINDITSHKYRVSIKSFPDYKYLLQEN